MKRIGLAVALCFVMLGVQSNAAPVDSKESTRTAAIQKVETVLAEKAVADQLAQLGLSQAEARARLARLSDAQLEQLAAQVDLIQAGGTIQGGDVAWPVVCMFKSLGTLLSNIFRVLFCWTTLK